MIVLDTNVGSEFQPGTETTLQPLGGPEYRLSQDLPDLFLHAPAGLGR